MKFDYNFFWRLESVLKPEEMIAIMVLYRVIQDEGLEPTKGQWKAMISDVLKGRLPIIANRRNL